MATSASLNFSGIGQANSAAVVLNAGEQARIRLSSVKGFPSISLAITRNGVVNKIVLKAATGATIPLPSCEAGDSLSINYGGETAQDVVAGVLETMADMVATVSPSASSATSTPLTGAVADTVAHSYGPFTPQLAREIWATLVGTGASGTAALQRSTDAGATKAGLTAGGDPWAAWAFSGVTGSIVNEQIGSETDAAATYYLAVTLTAGSLTYRIAQ